MEEETKQIGVMVTGLLLGVLLLSITGLKCNRDNNVVERDRIDLKAACIQKHSPADCIAAFGR